MKLSVIIPVYNMTRYLRECLDSVAAQSYPDWEAICIDDGSTDDSGAILDEYAARDPRFKVIHKKNGGVPSARNDGIAAAQGEWVAFIDSDDSVAPEWFAHATQLMTDDVDLVRLAVAGGNGDALTARTSPMHGADAARWGWRVFSTDGFPWLCFVRRERIGATRYRPDITYKEDMLFMLDLIPSLRGVVQGDYGGYNYRMVAGSMSKKTRPVVQSVMFQSACLDIWRTQRAWAEGLGVAAFVRERLRFVADHDVWEWTMRPGAGDKREIRRVYLALEREGALAKKWMHPKKRLVLPFYVWRLTGSFAGYWALEAGSKLLRVVKRRLRG